MRWREAAGGTSGGADKEALCAEWEGKVAAIDWEQVDYAGIETQRQQMLSQWRAAPQARLSEGTLAGKRLATAKCCIDQGVGAGGTARARPTTSTIASA